MLAFQKILKPNKISDRFRLINLYVFIVVLIIMFSALTFSLQGVIRDSATDYAQYYSLKTVSVLNSHLNREISLMTKAVQSKAIIAWFKDEHNLEKKQMAFDEMNSFMDILYGSNLYFGIQSSFNEYSIDKQSTFADLLPYDQLRTYFYDDAWYFECANSSMEYVLNVDIDKLKQRKRVWLNYKVMDDDQLLGVLSTGLQFDQVVQDLFEEYDNSDVRSLVIDEHGVVQIDSDMIGDPEFLIYDSDHNIAEYMTNSSFTSELAMHLNTIHGTFKNATPKVVRLYTGDYSFATIAPIEATTWTVVTLYDTSSLYNSAKLYPLFIIMFAMFALFMLVSHETSKRYIFTPFNLLIKSVFHSTDGKSEPIYGIERNDEIGELARTIQNQKDSLQVYTTNLESLVEARSAHIKNVYKQMAENEHRLSRVFDHIHIGLATFDSDRLLVHCNAFCLSLFKTPTIEDMKTALAMDHQTYVANDCFILSKLFDQVEMEMHTTMEVEMRSLDGNIFWTELTVEYIKDLDCPSNCGYEFYIVNIQNKKEIEYALTAKAHTDRLTGAFNRAYLDFILPSMISSANLTNANMTIVMMDIDFFKVVNDTYGHDVGDNALTSLSTLVSQNIRKSDLFFRWGGEEFLLLMKDITQDHAAMIADKLRKQIESTVFPDFEHMTVSFGVAQYTHRSSYEDWFKQADMALRMAKETGRNRVVVAPKQSD